MTSLPERLAGSVSDLGSPDPAVRRLLTGVLRRCSKKNDTRGHDADLDWLHPVTRGPDAVGELTTGWRDTAGGPVTAAVDNSGHLAPGTWHLAPGTWHLQLAQGVPAQPDGDVVNPAVRDDALQLLGSALAEAHWFYGSPA